MKINFWLNGAKKEAEISPDTMLLEFLRSLGCYSVKRGCETANCGLCTVLVNDKPMLSCSVLAARIDGKKVITMEGLQAEAEDVYKRQGIIRSIGKYLSVHLNVCGFYV